MNSIGLEKAEKVCVSAWVIFSVNYISFYLQLNVSWRFLLVVTVSVGDYVYY